MGVRRVFVCLCVTWLALVWALPAPSVGAAARGAAEERVTPAGEVLVVLNEDFLNALLDAITSLPTPPAFPLSRGGRKENAKCASEVVLLRESKGTRTAVRFEDGRVNAPVAFRGSYDAPLVGCFNFEGWADTALTLAFDPERQALDARIQVRSVNLRNVPTSLVGGGLTGLVQDAIDKRVNPVEILRAEQLGARLPLARSGELRLRAREVRHEIAGRELRLRIVYEVVRAE